MKTQQAPKFISETARDIEVLRDVDVAVVGGGPGGVAAAISAARTGAKTVLIERYGHLGGMATGGLINIFPNLSDISGKQHIFGLNQEIISRMEARGAAFYPKKSIGEPPTEMSLIIIIVPICLGSTSAGIPISAGRKGCFTLLSWILKCSKMS